MTERSQETQENFYPFYSAYLKPLFQGPMPSAVWSQMLSPQGALVGGSVQEVIDKILAQREVLGTTRYLGQTDIGGQPWVDVARGIELFAAKVAPVVRREASVSAS